MSFAEIFKYRPEILKNFAEGVWNFEMYPLFDIAHYIIMLLSLRKDMSDDETHFSARHPLSCWLSSMLLCFAGAFLSNFLLGESILQPFEQHRDIITASVLWYLVFYSPFDIVYQLTSFFPSKIILCMFKEIQRANKIANGVLHAQKLYPEAFVIQVLIGATKGAASSFIRTFEQIFRGLWVPHQNEFLLPSPITKACIIASFVFALDVRFDLSLNKLVYLAIVGFFLILRMFLLLSDVKDPFVPFENIVCTLSMGGILDTLLRTIRSYEEEPKFAENTVEIPVEAKKEQ